MSCIRKILAIATGLFLLYGLGLGMRRVVLETQYETYGADLPFTLESALHYRRAKIIYDTGTMPIIDPMIQYPEGVRVRETYEFGSEYVQVVLAKLLPASMSVAHRLRWIESAWFCLGIPFLVLWIAWWRKSWLGGFVAGAFYAVAISSIVRSTGQELSHENFALPLLIGHLAFQARALRATREVDGWFSALVSASLLGWSLASWDLIQFYIFIWFAAGLIHVLRGNPARREKIIGLLHLGALVVVGTYIPYYRVHGFLVSPLMLLMYGAALYLALDRIRKYRWTLLLLPLLVGLIVRAMGDYGSSYGHFAELLFAKIKFLNDKPADPKLLTFDQRIMWVPALHSANIQLTIALFPAILYASLIAAVVTFQKSQNRSYPEYRQLIFFYGVSLALYILFVRFHVFLALFAAALLGYWASDLLRGTGWKKWVGCAILGFGIFAEAAQLLRDPQRWGRPNVYYKELSTLVKWLEKNAAPEPVLANFGVSGSIATYGKCAILLHPKFESEEIRSRVRQYGELLFKGTEEAFWTWADGHGARYYVYALGEFSSIAPELQMRYFVDALNPPADAPARLFETQSEDLKYFTYLWGNQKYAVYKILSRADKEAAAQLSSEADDAFQRGDFTVAEEKAVEALKVHARQETAIRILKHVGSLKEQGFSYDLDHEQK